MSREIAKEITGIRDRMLRQYHFLRASEINEGFCKEFARRVSAKFPEAEVYDGYDGAGIVWTMSPWNHMHRFVKIGDLYYDSERVNGVRDWKLLPEFLYHRKQLGSSVTLKRVQ